MTRTANRLAPAFCVNLASLFVDLGALPADCIGGTAVTLVRRSEVDAAVMVAVTVQIDQSRHPVASLGHGRERRTGGIRAELGEA